MPAYKKPFIIRGTCVILMILTAGGFGLRKQRRRKDDSKRPVEQDERDGEEEV